MKSSLFWTVFAQDCLSCVHGTCVSVNQCECESYWTGLSCDVPICAANCTNNGVCVDANICKCFNGYYGNSCSTTLWFSDPKCYECNCICIILILINLFSLSIIFLMVLCCRENNKVSDFVLIKNNKQKKKFSSINVINVEEERNLKSNGKNKIKR